MNNVNSQAHHLQQCMAVVPLMLPNSIIIVDDTYLKGDDYIYSGKGGACVPYMVSQGWRWQDYDMGVVFWQ